MKRTILINAMMITKRNTGLGIYALKMLNELIPNLIDDFDVTIIVDELNNNDLKSYPVKWIEIKSKNFLKRNFFVKKFCRENNFDIYYSMSQHFFKIKNAIHIITIHDLIPLKYPKGRIHQWLYYRYLLPLYLKKINTVITVSNYTKQDIEKVYRYDNVIVAYCGNNYAVCDRKMYPRENYYIMVGIHYPYKNIHFVIQAFKEYMKFNNNTRLMIIGNKDCKYGRYLQKIVKKYNLQDRIFFTGYISDEQKEEYYQKTRALIFASKYEGFGLPIIEAMSKGTPVICSNSSCLPEIAGDAALIFENDNIDSLINCFEQLNKCTVVEKVIEKGYKNIDRFSWGESSKIIENNLRGY